MDLHVITPVSRPENLPAIGYSLRTGFATIAWTWWVVFDRAIPKLPPRPRDIPIAFWDFGPESHAIGGYSLRNHALEKIYSGWLYFLDDDNLIHPHLEMTFLFASRSYREGQWFIFRQLRPDGTIYLRPRCPPRVNAVDIGQCVLRRDLVTPTGEPVPPWRFGCHRAADGVFFERLGQIIPAVCLDVEATYYNALRGNGHD